MEIVKCNVCNTENYNDSHNCKKCGNNLTDRCEKTDLLFIISEFIKIIGLFVIIPIIGFNILFLPFFVLSGAGVAFQHLLSIGIGLLLISICIKEYALNLCKKNL